MTPLPCSYIEHKAELDALRAACEKVNRQLEDTHRCCMHMV
jgi:hypothetical protein